VFIPMTVRVSFALWLTASILCLPGGWSGGLGFFLCFGAFSLRSGFRGARLVLTFFGVLAATIFLTGLATFVLLPSITDRLGALWGILLGAVEIAASVLMWHPDTGDYMKALRRPPAD
jgi:hypothetical protein